MRSYKRQDGGNQRMNKSLIRKELLRLRDERFKDKGQFKNVSGLYDSLIRQVENQSVPRLEALEAWVRACGLTVSQFFQHLEELEHPSKTSRVKAEHPLIAACRHIVQNDPEIANALLKIVDRFLSDTPSRK